MSEGEFSIEANPAEVQELWIVGRFMAHLSGVR